MSCSDGAINYYMDYEPNRAPQVLDIQSDFSGLPVPGDIMKIRCKTYDPDGNPLSYTFTSQEGSFTNQVDKGERNIITFVIGNITGSEEVTVSVKVTDTKDASAAAALNIGSSSLGPEITIVKPVNRDMGADGYSTVTFRSNKENSMTLNWNLATDRDNLTGDQQQGMRYRVYLSRKDNISTLEDTDFFTRTVLDWAS